MEAREVFATRTVIKVLIKCSYGFNQYRTKDALINKIESIREYPCCSTEYEDWKHVIKCKENRHEKAEFIKQIAIELVKHKPPDIDKEEVMKMINNVRKYLIDRNDYEIN